jgi:hypothetical protein
VVLGGVPLDVAVSGVELLQHMHASAHVPERLRAAQAAVLAATAAAASKAKSGAAAPAAAAAAAASAAAELAAVQCEAAEFAAAFDRVAATCASLLHLVRPVAPLGASSAAASGLGSHAALRGIAGMLVSSALLPALAVYGELLAAAAAAAAGAASAGAPLPPWPSAGVGAALEWTTRCLYPAATRATPAMPAGGHPLSGAARSLAACHALALSSCQRLAGGSGAGRERSQQLHAAAVLVAAELERVHGSLL